jgi:hypothetical protein
MATLKEYGIPLDGFNLATPLRILNSKAQEIGKTNDWDEVKDILEKNWKDHPGSVVYIGYDDLFEIGIMGGIK